MVYFDILTKELKKKLPDYIKELRPEWNGDTRKTFRCLSPDHEDKNPSMGYDAKSNTFKCFSCGVHGDTLDLFMLVNGIKDKVEGIKRACEHFGIPYENRSIRATATPPAYSFNGEKGPNETAKEPIKTEQAQGPTTEHAEDERKIREYIEKCAGRINETTYWCKRGLNTPTVKAFSVGFDPECMLASNSPYPALIIPNADKTRFVARNLNAQSNNNRYRKHGKAFFFNHETLNDKADTRPIFIVEGEIDAMSIIQAGGRAIGLGSTSNAGQLLLSIPNKSNQGFILALDNDEAGQKGLETLEAGLILRGVDFLRCGFVNDYEDANDFLQKDPQGFYACVNEETTHFREWVADKKESERQARIAEFKKNNVGNYVEEFLKKCSSGTNAKYYPTGFKKLDKVLGGGLFSGLYIVGARTGLGKTSLILQIADYLASKGKDILFFSIEMGRDEMISRSLSRISFTVKCKELMEGGASFENAIKQARASSLTARDVIMGKRFDGSKFTAYDDEDKRILYKATCEYKNFIACNEIYSEGNFNTGIEEIKATVERYKEVTGEAPIVVIDYMQVLAPIPKFTDKQSLDNSVKGLKQLSRAVNTPIIAISSVSRASNKNEGGQILEDSFKESGGIEYTADVLLGMWKSADDPSGISEITVKVLKNRHGERDKEIKYIMYPSVSYFLER